MSISWLNYPAVANHESGDSFYADVINHYKSRESFNSRLTEAHEVSHFIHSDIRNAQSQSSKVNAFYVGQNKAAVIKEPSMSKAVVASYVPAPLRGFRYPTYITGMTEWNDRPLYIWDEWSAYVNGGQTGVGLVEANDYKDDWTDGVSGCLEFTIYAAATAMAVKEKDAATFNDPQFQGFLEFQSLRSESVFFKGSVMTQFKWDKQDQMLSTLRNDPQAANLRLFLSNYCKGSFLDRPIPDPNILDKDLFDLVGD